MLALLPALDCGRLTAYASFYSIVNPVRRESYCTMQETKAEGLTLIMDYE